MVRDYGLPILDDCILLIILSRLLLLDGNKTATARSLRISIRGLNNTLHRRGYDWLFQDEFINRNVTMSDALKAKLEKAIQSLRQ